MTTAPNHATRAIIETKRIDGKPAHRLEGTRPGCWIVAKSEIDAMLSRVQQVLGVRRMAVIEAIGADPSSISRCRAGRLKIQKCWIWRLADFSGIPVAELRQIACIEPAAYPDLRARRPV